MRLAPGEVDSPRADTATPAAASGSAAFGPLYREHFDGLYDFVVRMVRDSDLAGEIVQATFTKAWDELQAGSELLHPKAWLYTVARNRALDELRRQARLADEPLIYAQPDPSRLADPQAVAEDNELVELVWSSAAALSPDEYSLLDLHVRHGLDAAELADELQLERGAVYTRLSRLRNSLEESVVSTLLVRRGSADCDELAAIVAEHDNPDTITRELRRAVRAHVKQCEICTEARQRVASPVALFGALVPIVPLAGLREGILAAIVPGGTAHAAGAAAGAAGAAAGARQATKARYIAAGTGATAAVVAAVALAMSSGTALRDPARAFSVDHQVGVASTDRTITVHWSPGKDAKGYSVIFSRDKSLEPPARENVTGTQYTSAPLGPGRWWFILRSHGRDGSWTDTLRVGPFVISAPVARAAPHPVHARHKHTRHHRATPRPSPARAPARPAAAAATLVAGVRAAPRAVPHVPASVPPAPKAVPRPPPRKKPPRKPSPPAAPPAPAPPPPAPVAPPPQAPVSQPVSPPAPAPGPGSTGDDQGDEQGNGGGEGAGGDGGGGGQGNGRGQGHGNGH